MIKVNSRTRIQAHVKCKFLLRVAHGPCCGISSLLVNWQQQTSFTKYLLDAWYSAHYPTVKHLETKSFLPGAQGLQGDFWLAMSLQHASLSLFNREISLYLLKAVRGD